MNISSQDAVLYGLYAAGLVAIGALAVLVGRKWAGILVAIGATGCVLGAALSLVVPDHYTSEALLYVALPKGDDVCMSPARMERTVEAIKEEVRNIESVLPPPPASDHTAEQELEREMEAARNSIKVTIVPDGCSLFTVSASHTNREKARAITKFIAKRYTAATKNLADRYADTVVAKEDADASFASCKASKALRFTADSDCGKPFEISTTSIPIKELGSVEAASLPDTPSGPNRRFPAAGGLIAGLLTGGFLLKRKSNGFTVEKDSTSQADTETGSN